MRRFLGLISLAATLVACTDAPDAPPGPTCADPAMGPSELPACVYVPYTVTDHDGIASEDGSLSLLSGQVAIARLSLFEGEREVVWLEDQVLDLGASSGTLLATAPIPPGTYDRIEVVLAPLSSTTPTFAAEIDGDSFPAIDVWFEATVMGERFPSPALVITANDGDAVELPISLLSLFFYTWPYTDSVDGVFRAMGVEEAQATLEQNLLNLFAPRLIP